MANSETVVDQEIAGSERRGYTEQCQEGAAQIKVRKGRHAVLRSAYRPFFMLGGNP